MAVPRVLLVEPNDELRRLFRRRFVREGFELLEAIDGEAALGAAQAEVPDVIVVESSVRDAAGLDLAGRLASDPGLRAVPVIVLAARGAWPSTDEPASGVKDGAGASLLPDVAARAGGRAAPGHRQELRHPFRPGRLVELARGALAAGDGAASSIGSG